MTEKEIKKDRPAFNKNADKKGDFKRPPRKEFSRDNREHREPRQSREIIIDEKTFPKDSNSTGKDVISKAKMLEAGVYFGHRKAKWNPKMAPFILPQDKKGTHIIDIRKTNYALNFAFDMIKAFAEKGATFIFVGTRKQAKNTIKENALRTNSHYVSERWLGGTLTNSRTIFERVKRMFDLEKMNETNFAGYTKKEATLLAKELEKLQKNLSGIKTMRSKPTVMIVADPSHDDIAVKEAKKLGVKIIALVDTNADPDLVDIAIPANDDSVKSVTLMVTALADAIVAAKGGKQLFAHRPDEEIVLPEEEKEERKRPARFQRGNFDRRDRRPREDGRPSSERQSSDKAENKTTDKVERPKREVKKGE